jgi:predicted lactoylglutathione lyase
MRALSLDSKDQVDRMFESALKAGATEARDAMDYGFMFGRSFNDLDGHIWEIFWMDPGHVHK